MLLIFLKPFPSFFPSAPFQFGDGGIAEVLETFSVFLFPEPPYLQNLLMILESKFNTAPVTNL